MRGWFRRWGKSTYQRGGEIHRREGVYYITHQRRLVGVYEGLVGENEGVYI